MCLEPSRTSIMELLQTCLMGETRKLFLQKFSIIDVRLGYKYTSDYLLALVSLERGAFFHNWFSV